MKNVPIKFSVKNLKERDHIEDTDCIFENNTTINVIYCSKL